MSPKLKPLLLPQLVEERRKLEEQLLQQQQQQQALADGDASYTFYTTNSSSSDVASPVTPTFSARGHMRYSSSTSSLELPPALSETPSSPTQVAHAKAGKWQLPDVEEEPTDREEASHIDVDPIGLYACFCDEPCVHRESSDMIHTVLPADFDINYDIGFLSDGDLVGLQDAKKGRSGVDSPFSGIATRFGSKFPLRWKSAKRQNLTASSACELTFEHAMPLSGAASSRSSSLSSPGHPLDRANEPPLPISPALSFWESTESVNLPAAIDVEKANARESLERDRAMATTPLLPPLLMTTSAEAPQESPLQSPTVAPPSATLEILPKSAPHSHNPTPSLSAKPSISSFRPSPTSPELPIPFPNILQDGDEWSDKLGHANFIILPQPYRPDGADMECLRKLRADWDAARVNYTKHIVRTGENYGQTSKIYGLTEDKWAEIERTWRTIHDETMERILAASNANHQKPSSSRSRSRGRGRGRSGSGGAALLGRPATDDIFAGMQWRRLEDSMPTNIPRMDAEGKFPSRGDEDIVGPMARDAVMIRTRSEERKGANFWKSLVGKVSLRKQPTPTTYTTTTTLLRAPNDRHV